jgi:hypothetical protein
MLNQQPRPQASQPPESYSQKAPALTQAERDQASAWHLILTLPDDGMVAASQKMEAEARKKVANLQPETATEAEMRCALAEWRHARNLFTAMSSFVASVNQRLDAESKAVEKQNTLDKPDDSGTMAKD